MNPFASASRLLSISVAFALAGMALGGDVDLFPVPKLRCGTYTARGRLRLNGRGDFILSLSEKTYSQSELILLGGAIAQKTDKLRGRVTVEFYVPKAIVGNDRSFVFLQEFSHQRETEEDKDRVTLVRPEPCSNFARFKR